MFALSLSEARAGEDDGHGRGEATTHIAFVCVRPRVRPSTPLRIHPLHLPKNHAIGRTDADGRTDSALVDPRPPAPALEQVMGE